MPISLSDFLFCKLSIHNLYLFFLAYLFLVALQEFILETVPLLVLKLQILLSIHFLIN